jgi:peroxiredoxin
MQNKRSLSPLTIQILAKSQTFTFRLLCDVKHTIFHRYVLVWGYNKGGKDVSEVCRRCKLITGRAEKVLKKTINTFQQSSGVSVSVIIEKVKARKESMTYLSDQPAVFVKFKPVGS